MGLQNNFFEGMRAPLTFFLLSAVSCTTLATLCPQGDKYWNPNLERCVSCTQCNLSQKEIVLRPCEVHRDTLCGPFQALNIDWKLVNQHHHRHHGRHGHGRHREMEEGTEKHTSTGEVTISTEMPFTSTETLVWDWQAVALTLAVFACLLFFLVAALYSIHQARQWKRLKDNFEADVEELSARLNLMVTSGELTENLEPNTAPITDGNYMNNHCVYLEQLLVRKDSKIGPGNVYIEESNTNTMTKS